MKHISLFSGIGGFELASQWVGWQNIVSCEINPFGNRVLEYYWPEAYHHTDVKTLTYDIINAECTKRYSKGWRDDDLIVTGGFPCQPYSQAGKRKGKEDERHLWPEMLRVIREVRPAWVVGENVFGLINWSGGLVFDEVQADLEAEAYEVQPYVLPACAVNAPHRRDRVWFVAKRIIPYTDSLTRGEGGAAEAYNFRREAAEYISKRSEVRNRDTAVSGTGFPSNTKNIRLQQSGSSRERRARFENGNSPKDAANTRSTRFKKSNAPKITNKQGQFTGNNIEDISNWQNFPIVSPVRERNDGLSDRLSFEAVFSGVHSRKGKILNRWRKEAIKAAGNSIVPQVIYEIFKVIDLLERKEAKVA